MWKQKEYLLEGLKLLVPLHYDAEMGRYFEQVPDFEASPVYTPQGKPVVCAAQDACSEGVYEWGGACVDCGGCKFFSTKHPQELVGLCVHPDRIVSQ